jgi:hypothetical protein
MSFNVITSAYPKGVNQLEKWIDAGKVLYLNKEKPLIILEHRPLQLRGHKIIKGSTYKYTKIFRKKKKNIRNSPLYPCHYRKLQALDYKP